MTQRERRAALALRAPSLARYVVVALLVPVLLIATLAWLGRERQRAETLRTEAAASFQRRIDQTVLLSRLKDAETAQRGFLVTGNPVFLQPYEPARRDIARIIRQADLPTNSDLPLAYVDQVTRLVKAKFAELDRTLAAARAGDLPTARAIVANGTGKAQMDRLRDVIGRRIETEVRVSAGKQASFLTLRNRQQTVAWSILVLVSLALLVFLAIVWRAQRQRYRSLVDEFEAAERNATILNSTIDAIFILNPSGTVEVMNAAATRMLGYTSEALERRDISTILDLAPGDGSFHKRIGLVDGQLERSFLADRAVVHHDGREIAVDVAMGVMSLPSGDHIVVSLRDISERKRIERVKDDLMSTVSHELRTPLTSIVGSLGLLRSGAAGAIPGDAARLVEIAENNSRRLIRLINDMLDIDRIESGTLRLARDPIDLRIVVDRGCIGSEGVARSKDVTIDCHLPDRPVMVSGDADRLLQVVSNLMSNAVRAAPAGSAIDLSLAVSGDTAIVSVEDRGEGVPPAFRERIFGRFERAEHDAATGTGLGLAISREIVARHDGRIWFEDRPGGGARFCFSLALLGTVAARDADAPRVLVCEHDEAMASTLCALVVSEGCTYDVAVCSRDARARLHDTRYAALIVDLNLPEEGGLAFARAARDGDPPVEAPIVIVAGDTQGDDSSPSALDVVDWIDKPGDGGRLAKALRSALSRTRSRQPVVLHLDDDRDLLEVVAAALEPEVRIVTATDLASARAILQHSTPDAVIIDLRLDDGVGTDLIPFLVDREGLAIPSVIYSAQDVSDDLAERVDAVLVKARGSIPDLKATLRRIIRPEAGEGEA